MTRIRSLVSMCVPQIGKRQGCHPVLLLPLCCEVETQECGGEMKEPWDEIQHISWLWLKRRWGVLPMVARERFPVMGYLLDPVGLCLCSHYKSVVRKRTWADRYHDLFQFIFISRDSWFKTRRFSWCGHFCGSFHGGPEAWMGSSGLIKINDICLCVTTLLGEPYERGSWCFSGTKKQPKSPLYFSYIAWDDSSEISL